MNWPRKRELFFDHIFFSSQDLTISTVIMNYFIKTKQALTRECWELKFYQSKTWAGLGMIMRVIPALLYQPHLVCLAHSWVAQFTILRIKSLAHPPSLQHRCTRGNTHICNTYLFDTASNLNWVLHNSSNWGVYHKPNYVHRLASLFIFVFVFVFALVFVLFYSVLQNSAWKEKGSVLQTKI